jgi:hypothetical protein
MLASNEPFGAGVVFGEASASRAATFDGASGPESGALTFEGAPHATATRTQAMETAAKPATFRGPVEKGIAVRIAPP